MNTFLNSNINMAQSCLVVILETNSLNIFIAGPFFHGFHIVRCMQIRGLLGSFLPFPCTIIMNPQRHENDTRSKFAHHKILPKPYFLFWIIWPLITTFLHSFTISSQVFNFCHYGCICLPGFETVYSTCCVASGLI